MGLSTRNTWREAQRYVLIFILDNHQSFWIKGRQTSTSPQIKNSWLKINATNNKYLQLSEYGSGLKIQTRPQFPLHRSDVVSEKEQGPAEPWKKNPHHTAQFRNSSQCSNTYYLSPNNICRSIRDCEQTYPNYLPFLHATTLDPHWTELITQSLQFFLRGIPTCGFSYPWDIPSNW